MAKPIQEFLHKPRPAPLSCGVQHYEWGGIDAIPGLLGIENEKKLPYAELWIGAHHALPSVVTIKDIKISLDTLISKAPERILGFETMRNFGAELPFLLKVLSARKPLSIQAHPNMQQAKRGFSQENVEGIDMRDGRRNYHDENHKPELICALSDFYALRGFRPLAQIASVLESVQEFKVLVRRFNQDRRSLIDLYTNLMKMPQENVDLILGPVIDRLSRENEKSPFNKEHTEYWVLRADEEFSSEGHKDRGIFSVFLLNLVHLQPERAMFLPAGELHAYLEGTGIEIMANSNNVLRGGLTSKHIDVEELLSIMTFDCGEPEVLRAKHHPRSDSLYYYDTPAKEFQLSRLCLPKGQYLKIVHNSSVLLAIVTHGALRITVNGNETVNFTRGDTFMIPAGIPYEVSSSSDTVVYWASVPTA